MNELHLFSGAGGGILGGQLLGHTCVCAVEIEPFCRDVLLQRQRDGHLPRFPIWDDVTTFDGTPWRDQVDVVCGGYPCQPFSTASHGHTTAIDRWADMLRITNEVRPRFMFAENVSEDAITRACEDLEDIGYTPRYMQLSAADLGADHIRERYWLLAHTNNKGQLPCRLNAEVEVLPRMERNVWDYNPGDIRVSNGLPDRVHRFKALGNAQIPRVAAYAFTRLRESIDEN